MNARSFVCHVALGLHLDSGSDEVDCHASTKVLMTGRIMFLPSWADNTDGTEEPSSLH